MIVHVLLILKTIVFITSMLNRLVAVQIQGYVHTHTHTHTYHVIISHLSCFDLMYVSYQCLLFVVYSIMMVWLYAELKVASCTWA